ncbi:MAG: hypothetical protein GXP16_16920 [Gammaproteobacteria bacterium]|nr:hypothetical protein [Gammaproteobacteria bacterium]
MFARFLLFSLLMTLLTACNSGSNSTTPPEPVAASSIMVESLDRDNDGSVDETSTSTFINALGKAELIETDTDTDGISDKSIAMRYDDNGFITTQEYDDEIDGIIDSRVTFNNDARGNVLRTATDREADNIDDYIRTATYNQDNLHLTRSTDNDGDSIVDVLETWSYSTSGQIVEYAIDNNGDGNDDRIDTFTYDPNDELARRDNDFDADGFADFVIVYSYATVADDLERTSSIDTNGDGLFTRTDVHTWNSTDTLIAITRDLDSDNTLDEEYYWERNAEDQVVRFTNQVSGQLMREVVYAYNAENNLTRIATDSDGDGNIDQVSTYDYTDWTAGQIH